MTILQTARDRVLELLNASGKPAGVPEFTTRRWLPDTEIAADEYRGAVLFHRETPDLPQGTGGALTRRVHFLAVQVVTAVKSPDTLDDALEPARAWIVQQLGETTLDGLVHSIEEGETTWETAQLGLIHGAITVLMRLNFQTKRADLTQRS